MSITVGQSRQILQEGLPKSTICTRQLGVSEQGGQGSHAPPPNVRGGGPEYHLPPPPKEKNLGGLCPLGLVFFTLENVLCLLFESAIPGGEKA